FALLFLPAPPPTPISTLSLHDALPISRGPRRSHSWQHLRSLPPGHRDDQHRHVRAGGHRLRHHAVGVPRDLLHLDVARRSPSNSDRKSTRLNSSHLGISYAVFCLKKKI